MRCCVNDGGAYLVNGRNGLPCLCQLLQNDFGAVGNSNSLDFTTCQYRLHLGPSLGLIPFGIDISATVFFKWHDGRGTVRDQSADISSAIPYHVCTDLSRCWWGDVSGVIRGRTLASGLGRDLGNRSLAI